MTCFDFYPVDFLDRIPQALADKVTGYILINREVQAIQLVLDVTGFPLMDACRVVQAHQIHMERCFPHPILAETHVLVALGQLDWAAQRISAFTALELNTCTRYVSIVQNNFPFRVTPTQVEKLLSMTAEGQRLDAAHYLGEFNPAIGLGAVIDFTWELDRYYQNVSSTHLPAPYRYHIPAPGERYAVPLRRVVLDPEIEQLVNATFPESSREGISYALNLYREMDITRVQRAILKQSEGDERTLLHLIGIAKIDFRDVLIGEEI